MVSTFSKTYEFSLETAKTHLKGLRLMWSKERANNFYRPAAMNLMFRAKIFKAGSPR